MSEEKSCSCNCSCSAKSVDANPAFVDQVGDVLAPLARSIFRIPGMDCPAEEQMIRLRLADAPVAAMRFDLPGRQLTVDHAGDAEAILQRLQPLGYGTELQTSFPLNVGETPISPVGNTTEARVLWILLSINALMFVIELIAGWWAGSAGLISDGADMFADAAVYGLALYAVGRDAKHKLAAARLSGLLQLVIAVSALTETGRRMIMGSLPEGLTMIWISLLALAANIVCLVLIFRHRDRGVHMRASYIFSANDVLANVGVIAAGLLIGWTASPWPDWIIGFSIGIMVLIGAVRILRLR